MRSAPPPPEPEGDAEATGIEKPKSQGVRIGRNTYSKTSFIELAAVVGFALASVWLFAAAWSDYSLYGNFNTALRAQAAGRPEDVLPALEPIARARDAYPYPAELAAKRNVDDGTATSLKEAVDLYGWLLANGHDRPTVHLGLAAAHLRMSDLATGAERNEHLERAGGELASVKDWVESKILEAHLMLRRGNAAGAQSLLQSALDAARGGTEVTHDSLVDLFVGLGVCASRQGRHQDAARFFRSARHLMPRTRVPFLNTVASYSRRYVEEPIPADDLLRDYEKLISRARNEWKLRFDKDSVTYRGLDRALFNYGLSIGWALTKHNQVESAAIRTFEDAASLYPSGTPTDLARKDIAIAAACQTQLRRQDLDGNAKTNLRWQARTVLDRAAHALDDPAQKAAKALVLNNLAVFNAEDLFREERPSPADVARVREQFEQAAAAVEGDAKRAALGARILRNLGAFHLRLGATEKARASLEKAVQLDAAGAGGDEVKSALDRLRSGGAPAPEEKKE